MTFIKTNFKISDDQTNIDKYSSAANIKEYHNILELNYLVNYDIGFGIPNKFPVEKKIYT